MLYNISSLNKQNNIQSVKDLPIKISVIVPCYNVESYIERCVDSIVNQSIGRDKLEIILVNDASTDNTYNVLLKLEQQYPEQILVIHCTENGRQGRARNIGLSYATGDYITFVDSDDIIDLKLIEKLTIGLVQFDTQIAECDIKTFSDINEIKDVASSDSTNSAQLVLIESMEESNVFFINHAFDTAVFRRLYRRDFLEELQLFFPEQIFMEDIYFTQLAMIYCRSMYKLNQPLYYYYQNPNATMLSDRSKGYYMDVHKVSAMVIEELKNRGLYNDYRDALKIVYEKKVFEDLTAYMKNKFEQFPEENYQVMLQYMKDNF